MAKQHVMDQTGHTTHEFSPSDTVGVADAMARFEELTRKGFRAARTKGPGQHELVRSFDPSHEETIFFPPLVGG